VGLNEEPKATFAEVVWFERDKPLCREPLYQGGVCFEYCARVATHLSDQYFVGSNPISKVPRCVVHADEYPGSVRVLPDTRTLDEMLRDFKTSIDALKREYGLDQDEDEES
jgi:hypothetical protein